MQAAWANSNLVSDVLQTGWRFCKEEGKLVLREDLVAEDGNMEDDERTALAIREIANSVHPMIQMEEDFPSAHNDGKLPILDLKCWIDSGGVVWFQHYKTDMRKGASSQVKLADIF